MQVTITVSDESARRMLGRLSRYQPPIREAVDLAHDQISAYPRSNSRYRRTGELGRSWKKEPGAVVSRLPYAVHVLDETRRLRRFSHWTSIQHHARLLAPRIRRLFERNLRKVIG